MSTGTPWRSIFTFNRYTQIAARALQRCLRDEARVAAERRGVTLLKYQQWTDGEGGTQTLLSPDEHRPSGKSAAS